MGQVTNETWECNLSGILKIIACLLISLTNTEQYQKNFYDDCHCLYWSLFEYIIIDYEHFICYLLIQF